MTRSEGTQPDEGSPPCHLAPSASSSTATSWSDFPPDDPSGSHPSAEAEASLRRLVVVLRAQIRCVRLLSATDGPSHHARERRALNDLLRQGRRTCDDLQPVDTGSPAHDLVLTFEGLMLQGTALLTDEPGSDSEGSPGAHHFPLQATRSNSALGITGDLEDVLTLLDQQLIVLKKQRVSARYWSRGDIATSQDCVRKLVATCTALVLEVPEDDTEGQKLVEHFGRMLQQVASISAT